MMRYLYRGRFFLLRHCTFVLVAMSAVLLISSPATEARTSLGRARSPRRSVTFCGDGTVVGGVHGTSLRLHPLRGGASTSGTNSAIGPAFGRRPPSVPRQPSQKTTTSATTFQTGADSQVEAKEILDSFLTRDSRNSFIARVYAILVTQLLVTALSVTAFGVRPELSSWMLQRGSFGVAIPLLSLFISTGSWFVMCLSSTARRKSPLKWQLLSLFTAGEAITVGFISSFYNFKSVVTAMMTTAVATAAVSLYTANQKNPKYDLSQWGATLVSWGFIFLVYGVIQMLQVAGVLPAGFLPYSDVFYCLAGACLFSFYLAYHTKLIVAGKHAKFQMSEKDYVFGAMTLYNDIINIFIYMLRLIGEDREK